MSDTGRPGSPRRSRRRKQAQSQGLAVDITVLEKSREDEAGGNTRWSPSNMRLDAPDRIDPGFADDMLRACGGQGDPGYFRTLADNATATVGWLQGHGVEFVTPLYYLSRRSGPDPAGRRRQRHRRKTARGRTSGRG